MSAKTYMASVRQVIRQTEAEVLTEHSVVHAPGYDPTSARSALGLVNLSLALLFELHYIQHASRSDLLEMLPKLPAKRTRK